MAAWDDRRVRLELYALLNKRLPDIENSISGSLIASNISVVPNVDLISTDVQAALEELQAEILAITGLTDLSFSGVSSPVTLNSSSGVDVTFTAGPGISLTGSPTNLTITNTGGGGGLSSYTMTFGNVFTETILPATHGLTAIHSVLVLTPTGDKVEVSVNISGLTVLIESNVNLLNHVLVLGNNFSGGAYTQILPSTFTEIISPATHGLSIIKSILVTDPSGNEVTVEVSIVANTVTINSNINLLNHLLTLS